MCISKFEKLPWWLFIPRLDPYCRIICSKEDQPSLSSDGLLPKGGCRRRGGRRKCSFYPHYELEAHWTWSKTCRTDADVLSRRQHLVLPRPSKQLPWALSEPHWKVYCPGVLLGEILYCRRLDPVRRECKRSVKGGPILICLHRGIDQGHWAVSINSFPISPVMMAFPWNEQTTSGEAAAKGTRYWNTSVWIKRNTHPIAQLPAFMILTHTLPPVSFLHSHPKTCSNEITSPAFCLVYLFSVSA